MRKIESKEVKLKRGTYNESSLVDKVCSEAQRRSYHHKEKFASGKHQMELRKISTAGMEQSMLWLDIR